MDMNKVMQKIDAIKFCENGEMISLSNLKKEISKIEKQHNIKSDSHTHRVICNVFAHRYNTSFNYQIAKFMCGF